MPPFLIFHVMPLCGPFYPRSQKCYIPLVAVHLSVRDVCLIQNLKHIDYQVYKFSNRCNL